jgi:hypothetical protein
MRPPYRSITPAVVRSVATDHLRAAFAWTATDSVSVDHMLRFLLLMATGLASVFHVVRRLFPFSHDSARRAVYANCPSLEAVAGGLNRALHRVLECSRLDRSRGWEVAIDTHFVPYYGRRTGDVVGGPRKAGTKHFFGYATAALVARGHRYTIAIEALRPKARPHEVVRRLLDRVAGFGLRVNGVAADCWFDSGDTLLLLQGRRLAYAVPLRRFGRKANARNRLFGRPTDTVHTADWKTDAGGRAVTTAVYVWHRRRRGKHPGKVMAIAFGGRGGAGPGGGTRAAGRAARDAYRARFGIETTYRQKNQARAVTTSRNAPYRLLLEGLAHLVRQVWALLTEQLGRATGTGDPGWVSDLPLKLLVRWLDDALRDGLTESREIPLGDSS